VALFKQPLFASECFSVLSMWIQDRCEVHTDFQFPRYFTTPKKIQLFNQKVALMTEH